MSIQKSKKLKNLLSSWPPHTVGTSKWLDQMGVSKSLRQRYVSSGWLNPLGPGAFICLKNTATWEGAVYALQSQLKLNVWVGGRTALEQYGLTHFVPLGASKIFLFSYDHLKLPKWFKENNWGHPIHWSSTTFLSKGFGLETLDLGDFNLVISSPERAALEVIYSTPKTHSFEELSLLMENLTTLRPDVLQELLENCHSYKVKRLILFFGEYHQHLWLNQINQATINLGSGVIPLVKNGRFHSKYQMMLPKEFVDPHETSIF